MSALSPSLARRLDRLARGAHAFHRFAHHPLCGAYAGEVLRLGRRTRLCRGCAFSALGATVGFIIGAAAPASATLTAISAAIFGLSLAPSFLGPRLPKLAGRALPLCAAAAAITLALRTQTRPALAIGIATALVLLAAWLGYRRRGPNRDPCSACPERAAAHTCSGFAPIVRRERAFQRLAARWIGPARSELH